MIKLTTFQKNCESNLLSFLSKNHIQVHSRILSGIFEKFVEIILNYPRIKIWIYDNSAEYKYLNRDVGDQFEWQDYDNETELINDLLKNLHKEFGIKN